MSDEEMRAKAAAEGAKQIEELTAKVIRLEQESMNLRNTLMALETTIRVQAALINPQSRIA